MFRTARLVIAGVLLACLVIVVCPAWAQTWNLAGDFSTTSNPNGPWDVGVTTATLGFNSYGNTPYDFFPMGTPPPHVRGWGGWQIGAVAKNVTGAEYVSGQHWIPQDGMFIMPVSNEKMMGTAWTSPVSGIVHVFGRFYGATVIDVQPAAVGPWQIALMGGPVLANGYINGAVAGGAYSAVGTNAEDAFDLMVAVDSSNRLLFGCGDLNTWASSRFGLDLTIEAVSGGVGLVKGTVIDRYTSQPLVGAVVSVVGDTATATTDDYGRYYLLLPAGGYSLEASLAGYQPQTESVSVAVGEESVVDFDLASADQWNLSADFSTMANPNGVWDVGATSPGLVFSSYGNTSYDFYFANQVRGWGAWLAGAVAKNITGGDFVGWTGQHWIPKDGIFIMPASNENVMGAAWTSPITGKVAITGRFYGATVIAPQVPAVGPWKIVVEGDSILASGSISGAVAGGGYSVVGSNPEDTFGLLVDVTAAQKLLFGCGDQATYESSRFGLDLDIQLVSEPTGIVKGTVRSDTSGNPGVSGATVQVVGTPTSTKTDSDGEYLLVLPVGDYTLEVSRPSYVSQTAGVTVTDGAAAAHDFVLEVITNWNLSTDFSYVTHPYGQWDYGYVPQPGPLGGFRSYGQTQTYSPGAGALVYGWGDWFTGAINKNVSGADIWIWTGDWIRKDGMLIFPGLGPFASARWTSPVNDSVSISATFAGSGTTSGRIATSDVHVLKNGVSLWDGYVNGRIEAPGVPGAGVAPTQTYTGQIAVNVGDTIDFVIGDGGDGRDGPGMMDYLDLDASIFMATLVSSIGEAKVQPDGTAVVITAPKVVTCATDVFSGGYYYIEDEDRSSGIKVEPATGAASVAVGDRLSLTGNIDTDANGERILRITSVSSQTSGTPLKPVGMTGRATGQGPDAVGLLVKLWGTVTYSDMTNMLYFYLDDGSKLQDGGVYSGIRVLIDGGEWTDPIWMRYPNSHVAVTGLLGKSQGGISVLRPRGEGDMTDL